MTRVELILKDGGTTASLDLLDFEYRLNKTLWSISTDRLKSLGGTYSTEMKLAKSKNNNKFFLGKGRLADINRFHKLDRYEAEIRENGTTITTGTFDLERVDEYSYSGTFYGEDVSWIDELDKIQLNELGYVDGSPTWLVDFNGAASFNDVNEKTNRQTDFICPTIVYNNTPITDYLDLTDDEIWGVYEEDSGIFTQISDGLRLPNDLPLRHGYFGNRLGLTFEDFPPAVYYRNLIEKVFSEIGMSVDCSLFDEDWFNALYMPYVGNGYNYNWKNLAEFIGEPEIDAVASLSRGLDVHNQPYGTQSGNLADIGSLTDAVVTNLPTLNGTTNWISDTKIKYKGFNILRYPDLDSDQDHGSNVNKFDLRGYYIVPQDGNYTIEIKNRAESYQTDFNKHDHIDPPSGTRVWDGYHLFNSYATQQANSPITSTIFDRHYAWDDQVLIVLREDSDGKLVYEETLDMLYQWMSGMNDDFINTPNDVIAYYSPKRALLTGVPTEEIMGSPLKNFPTDADENVVVLDTPTHSTTAVGGVANGIESSAHISINVDLYKNERVKILWVSLADIEGRSTTQKPHLEDGVSVQPYYNASNEWTYTGNEYYTLPDTRSITKIEYNCGERQLDLASNLPSMSCKQFISQFIKQFNLQFSTNGNTVSLIPAKQYYSSQGYNITDRVQWDSWTAKPISVPKTWNVGYTKDDNDRLLNLTSLKCSDDASEYSYYANVRLDNLNSYSKDISETFSMFAPTMFTEGVIEGVDKDDTVSSPFTEHPDTNLDVGTFIGFDWSAATVVTENGWFFPSIQSRDSYEQEELEDLEYDYNYTPRLLYHLGTTENILALGTDYQVLVDSPMEGIFDITYDRYWFRPTISSFDGENDQYGAVYPTLRYDTLNGLYNRYFENLIDMYNEGDIITVNMAMTKEDWREMTGNKEIILYSGRFRLLDISDYDPLTKKLAKVSLLKLT